MSAGCTVFLMVRLVPVVLFRWSSVSSTTSRKKPWASGKVGCKCLKKCQLAFNMKFTNTYRLKRFLPFLSMYTMRTTISVEPCSIQETRAKNGTKWSSKPAKKGEKRKTSKASNLKQEQTLFKDLRQGIEKEQEILIELGSLFILKFKREKRYINTRPLQQASPCTIWFQNEEVPSSPTLWLKYRLIHLPLWFQNEEGPPLQHRD